MLPRLPVSFQRACPRCAYAVEPDFRRTPPLARLIMRLTGQRSAWRWCRYCNWRGLAPRGISPQPHRG